ncbi:hypothetical protein LINPERPRIM_LOCUS1689, partial [Linum perenne]
MRERCQHKSTAIDLKCCWRDLERWKTDFGKMVKGQEEKFGDMVE